MEVTITIQYIWRDRLDYAQKVSLCGLCTYMRQLITKNSKYFINVFKKVMQFLKKFLKGTIHFWNWCFKKIIKNTIIRIKMQIIWINI